MSNLFIKNTATNWQSKLIDLDSALLVLSSQTFDQMKNWHVFFDGDDKWKPVLLCPEIIEKLMASTAPPVEVKNESIQMPFQVPVDLALESVMREHTPTGQPEAPTTPPVQASTTTESQQPVAQVDDEPDPIPDRSEAHEKRQHARYEVRLRTIIKSGKNTYLTYTQDVSLGGLCLINDVPEYIFNSEAEIYITAPDGKNNIMFTCLPIATKLGKSRLMFTRVEASKKKIFEAWIYHFVRPSARKVS